MDNKMPKCYYRGIMIPFSVLCFGQPCSVDRFKGIIDSNMRTIAIPRLIHALNGAMASKQ